MVKLVRWGVVGAGGIARQFAANIAHAPGNALAAIAGRNAASADSFPAGADVARFASPQALFDARCCDAIYIATPNDSHAALAVAALESGHPVLVEKPLAVTAAEGRAVAAAAARAGLPAMEAMWTLFLPALAHARSKVAAGALGTLRRVRCELAFRKPYDPASRFFAPASGGGALRDLGIYGLSVARALCGPLELRGAEIVPAPNGIDMRAVLRLRGGECDVEVVAGFDTDGANCCLVEGDKGTLLLDAPFLKCQSIFSGRHIAALSGAGLAHAMARKAAKLTGAGHARYPFAGGGLQFEIAAFSRAVVSGDQSALWPLAHSVELLDIIDAALSRAPAAS